MTNMFRAGLILACLALTACATVPAREPVLVAGATGKTGKLIVAELLERGYPVRVLARDPVAARGMLPPQVEVATADLQDRAALADALRGVRRVISAAGAATLDENAPNGPRVVDFEGVRNLVDAARSAKVARFVLISSQNVTAPERYGFAVMRPLLKWKLRGEDALRRSDLAYTIVRPGQLLDGPGGALLQFSQGDTLKGPIDRTDLARACVEALARGVPANATFELVGSKAAGRNDWRALFGSLRPDPRSAAVP